MGSHEMFRKENKKPKKDAKKQSINEIVPPPAAEVQVVRKKRKETEI